MVLLQAVAILIAVFQYGMEAAAAGEDVGRNSYKILSSAFYPYLTARYVTNASNDVLFSNLHNCMDLFKLTLIMQYQFFLSYKSL